MIQQFKRAVTTVQNFNCEPTWKAIQWFAGLILAIIFIILILVLSLLICL